MASPLLLALLPVLYMHIYAFLSTGTSWTAGTTKCFRSLFSMKSIGTQPKVHTVLLNHMRGLKQMPSLCRDAATRSQFCQPVSPYLSSCRTSGSPLANSLSYLSASCHVSHELVSTHSLVLFSSDWLLKFTFRSHLRVMSLESPLSGLPAPVTVPEGAVLTPGG